MSFSNIFAEILFIQISHGQMACTGSQLTEFLQIPFPSTLFSLPSSRKAKGSFLQEHKYDLLPDFI